jgi:hypothetical protein
MVACALVATTAALEHEFAGQLASDEVSSPLKHLPSGKSLLQMR